MNPSNPSSVFTIVKVSSTFNWYASNIQSLLEIKKKPLWVHIV